MSDVNISLLLTFVLSRTAQLQLLVMGMQTGRVEVCLHFDMVTSQILCSVSVILHVSLITYMVPLTFKTRRWHTSGMPHEAHQALTSLCPLATTTVEEIKSCQLQLLGLALT